MKNDLICFNYLNIKTFVQLIYELSKKYKQLIQNLNFYVIMVANKIGRLHSSFFRQFLERETTSKYIGYSAKVLVDKTIITIA